MQTLKYKVINSKSQYKEYCEILEQLVFLKTGNQNTKDEIDLLTVLIEKWDSDHIADKELDPIQLLRSMMEEHELKATDLVHILQISKGYVSDILNYKKGLSKEVIRKLAGYFKLSQEAFNRPYQLNVGTKARSAKVTRRHTSIKARKPQLQKLSEHTPVIK